jgi:hypothetical protein
VRDSFEIKLLWQLPESHSQAAKDDDAWCTTVKKSPAELLKLHTFPVPPCPECVLEPWVVLAKVSFSANTPAAGANIWQVQISYRDRRCLLATQRLQTAMLCMP